MAASIQTRTLDLQSFELSSDNTIACIDFWYLTLSSRICSKLARTSGVRIGCSTSLNRPLSGLLKRPGQCDDDRRGPSQVSIWIAAPVKHSGFHLGIPTTTDRSGLCRTSSTMASMYFMGAGTPRYTSAAASCWSSSRTPLKVVSSSPGSELPNCTKSSVKKLSPRPLWSPPLATCSMISFVESRSIVSKRPFCCSATRAYRTRNLSSVARSDLRSSPIASRKHARARWYESTQYAKRLTSPPSFGYTSSAKELS
mmetsp:Transcript_17392/g.45412  ORF Transcript_17392/g.45412 Transcript_17392/m.45412 type:complete len:255 (-) Transcript_17392:456-1220(-)